MKKFFYSLKFFSKMTLLVLLLIFGWAFVNITNLVKGKKEAKDIDKDTSGLWGPSEAQADEPFQSKGSSTPFLAYFDGKEYRLENDIMFGRPKSYWYTYDEGKKMYEDGRISPDLYKIGAMIKPHNDRILFQIQEIELEESFFKWIELKRIVHPQNTEVIVDSEYKKFYVLPKKEFIESIKTPKSAFIGGVDILREISEKKLALDSAAPNKGISFEPDEHTTITFEGLKQGLIPRLLIKSWFRDWVLGLEEDWAHQETVSWIEFFRMPNISRTFLVLLLFPLFGFLQKRGLYNGLLAATPLFIGSGSMCACSFVYEYKDSYDQYNTVTISEPRAWHYNTEIIELPKESVLPDGSMEIRIKSSKRHILGFAGVSQEAEKLEVPYREEKIKLLKAEHDRIQKDFASLLRERENLGYMHTVPGDKVSLEFESPKTLLTNGEKETYLIRASGFYTSLRPRSRRLAGKWQERISDEAKSRLKALIPLKQYK